MLASIAMVPASVAAFREEFRRDHIGPRYSGVGHAAFTSLAALAGITLCALRISAPTALEWLTVPLTFCFANLVEYLAHRGPMHHRSRINFVLLRLLHSRHALAHHRYYTDEAMAAESPRDWKMVLFPPSLILIFIGLILVPLYCVLHYAISPNVGSLFCATGLSYFLTYEWLHLAYHVPAQSPIGRLRIVRVLRRHHALHHAPARMQRWNFNITFPIADAVFGTTWREPSPAPDQPPSG